MPRGWGEQALEPRAGSFVSQCYEWLGEGLERVATTLRTRPSLCAAKAVAYLYFTRITEQMLVMIHLGRYSNRDGQSLEEM